MNEALKFDLTSFLSSPPVVRLVAWWRIVILVVGFDG